MNVVPEPTCDFEALITLVTDHPKVVGYFPQFHYPGDDTGDYLICLTEGRDVEGNLLIEGSDLPLTFQASMVVLAPEFKPLHRSRLAPGVQFELREGKRVTATGIVTRLTGLNLMRDA
jgi:hypothetical protein